MPRGRQAGMPAFPADGLDEAPSSPLAKNRVVRAIIRGLRKSRRSGIPRKKKKKMGSYRAPKGPGRGQQHQPPPQQQEKPDGPDDRARSAHARAGADPQRPSTGRPPVGHVLILRDGFDPSIHPSRLAVCEGSVPGQIFVGWIGVSDEAKRSGQVDETLLSDFHEHSPSEAEAEMMILPALLSAQDRWALGYFDEDDNEDEGDEGDENDEDDSYDTEDNADLEKDLEKEEQGKEQAMEEPAKEKEKNKHEKKRERKSGAE